VRLEALSPREASIFACLTDAVVAPRKPLPPVADTDAVAFFDAWLARAPRLNRVALRGLLYAVELGPHALGARRRLRRLGDPERARVVEAAQDARLPGVRQLARFVKVVALLSYYGDDAVMRALGYDADANVRRGRELRVREGRA
jgi:hypothetical protein